MDEPGVPAQRASDSDRERVAERLRWAAGDGQITFEELDTRLDAAYASRTRSELVPLTADLQVPGGSASAAVGPAGGWTLRPGHGGARWLVAIMGGCERKGRWRVATRLTSINLMGGSDLDFNQAEFGGEHVEVTVFALMGGADIRVPHGLRVEVSELAVMGGNSIDIADDHPVTPGPVLHLKLFSLMGGTDVKRGPKRTRAERKALKRERV